MKPDRVEGFDALYRTSSDPWKTSTRWYEERRRALLLGALPDRRYERAYEAGCGNGNVSEVLASRCSHLVASDASAEAVDLARERLRGLPNVEVRRELLPDDWPDAAFDLIVLSELLYFLSSAEVDRVAALAVHSTAHGGTVVACNWRDDIEGYGHRGDEAHRRFDRALGLPKVFEYIDDDFVLSGWSVETRSVAMREGLR